MQDVMQGIVNDLEEVKDDLFPQILHSIKAVKKQFKLQLLAYLQEGGVSYKDTRSGEKNKQVKLNLAHQAEDFVVYKDSKSFIRFGIIQRILSQNVVDLKIFLNGKTQVKPTHIRLLKLIYRKGNKNSHVNID